jgi:hypothetical protein
MIDFLGKKQRTALYTIRRAGNLGIDILFSDIARTAVKPAAAKGSG